VSRVELRLIQRSPLLFWVLGCMAYVASRAPLLPLGFGRDPDAWSMAAKARRLILEGDYQISRAPGHPVYELVQSLAVVAGGALASNALTLCFSVLLLLVVLRLANAANISDGRWAVAILAVHPLFWISSVDSTDFILATLLAHLSVLAALAGSGHWAGALLGLAGATRIETLGFAAPLFLLGRGIGRARAAGLAALTCAVCYAPVAAVYSRSPGPLSDLWVSDFDLPTRARVFATALWAAVGLVPLLVLTALLVRERSKIIALLRGRDALTLSVAMLLLVYLSVTFVHPTKPTYYVPILPLLVIFLVRLASARWRIAIALAFLSYAFAYPDVVDSARGSLEPSFHWNNGLVVKDWIARWNGAHVAEAIDQHRRSGPRVIVLGYWLDPWVYLHPEALPVTELAPGIPVDRRRSSAYAVADGTRAVHKLDRSTAEAIVRAGIPLAYAEGIDKLLHNTYGYDISQLGAEPIQVLDLPFDVAERFALPALLRCGLGDGRALVPCVRSAVRH